VTSAWTDAAIYKHTDYGALTSAMLRGGEVRIKPDEVAQRQTENGLNSPTERPTNLHIVKVAGRLAWTSVRDPEGFFRVLTQPTKGVMSVDASSTAPGVTQSGRRYDADFRYGPGTSDDRPSAASIWSTPTAASKTCRPFKRGVWNRLFVHTDQLEVADTEHNDQPFLQDFAGFGPQWVTTLKPRGRTFTTAALMTTGALDGKTPIWVVPPGRSLIGNQRSLDIVRGESFPGITFAQAGGSDAGGKFRVVEPRQIFPGGQVQFFSSCSRSFRTPPTGSRCRSSSMPSPNGSWPSYRRLPRGTPT
jgi:hypothetical protein